MVYRSGRDNLDLEHVQKNMFSWGAQEDPGDPSLQCVSSSGCWSRHQGDGHRHMDLLVNLLRTWLLNS